MAERAFAALPPAALRRVRLGGLEAVYHVPSGITHLLAEPVPDLLDMLEALGPDRFVTPAGLAARISERFDLVHDEPVEVPETVLAERLGELAALGIIASRMQA